MILYNDGKEIWYLSKKNDCVLANQYVYLHFFSQPFGETTGLPYTPKQGGKLGGFNDHSNRNRIIEDIHYNLRFTHRKF